MTVHGILCGVLQYVGAELSAHETIKVEQDAWGSIAQLAAEYGTPRTRRRSFTGWGTGGRTPGGL
ncbi:hypothetical protein [Marisediminicola antarctica]|uniref:hypothetical protein n=1 Tax=Marisediminicola antarctica TaxID=674079 RepID=UPI00192A3264|nr:hypothetical protein [Marisediminicola antarctica]